MIFILLSYQLWQKYEYHHLESMTIVSWHGINRPWPSQKRLFQLQVSYCWDRQLQLWHLPCLRATSGTQLRQQGAVEMHWLPSGHQAWLAGKSHVNGGFKLGKSSIFMVDFPARHVWLLELFDIAMDNGPCIDDFPGYKPPFMVDFPWLC